MSDALRAAMAEFDRVVLDRDVAAADRVLHADYALVISHPAPGGAARASWLALLPDYVVHAWTAVSQVVAVDGETAVVCQVVDMNATVMGNDRSGRFVLTDVWRAVDGQWRVWRRHSTPLSAGVLPTH